ncbi:hypothetical protein ACP70R_014400 [Stipagrostis hirtigluma subsp. patula]
MAIQSVELSDQKDTVTWKWTADGLYSARSAYNIQFIGSVSVQWDTVIWKASTEPKCKFFGWLAILNKLNTAENLQRKGWPCAEFCALCYCEQETVQHLLVECFFAEAVLTDISQRHDLPRISIHLSIEQALSAVCQGQSKRKKRVNAGILLYTWWELWKERNRRIFNDEERSYKQVVNQITEDVHLFSVAGTQEENYS